MISKTAIINCLEKQINFLQTVQTIANCHMVDFFTKSLWKNVPETIRNEISSIGAENALNVLQNLQNNVDAPTLYDFIENTESLILYNCKDVCISVNELLDRICEWGFESNPSLQLKVFMNSKKSHEVEIMGRVAATIAKLNQTSYVIDVGDGKGYLSSMLALHHNIPVLGIDASPVNTQGAAKRAIKLQKHLKNITSSEDDIESAPYKQVTLYVTENTCFKSCLQNQFGLNETEANNVRLGLVGLHTCGSLAVSSLKLFQANENIKTLLNVGCCYHLIDSDPEQKYKYFPLSSFIKQQPINIDRNCKMIAMQSIDRQIFCKQNSNDVLFYRSILQVFLVKHFKEYADKHVGRMKKECKTFLEYSKWALKKLGINDVQSYQTELNAIYEEYKPKRLTLNLYYLIRARLGPIVEAIILLDRLLYLIENDYTNSILVQLFNPVTSPRCYGIVAFK